MMENCYLAYDVFQNTLQIKKLLKKQCVKIDGVIIPEKAVLGTKGIIRKFFFRPAVFLDELMPRATSDQMNLVINGADEIIVEQMRSMSKIHLFAFKNWSLHGNYAVRSMDDFLYSIDSSRPFLGYFETHLTYHCNLKCKGCWHLSNLAKPEFADLGSYTRDMKRLAELYGGIGRVRLMGGGTAAERAVA